MESRSKNLKETYNRIAEDWHKDHQQDDWWLDGTSKFVSFLKPGALVLDAGSGGGTKAKYLAQLGFRITGIDFSENMVKIAKREVPDGTFLVWDLKHLDSLTGSFDGILAQAVLLHFPKQEAPEVVQNMTMKLNNGGYLLVTVKEKRSEQVEEEVKREDDYGYEYERFFSYFTQDEVESYMKDYGLKIVYSVIKPSGKTNWIQVIGKK